MFNLGSKIKDPLNNVWMVNASWKYVCEKSNIEYLCLALVGVGAIEGQMGGARFRQGEAITIKRT